MTSTAVAAVATLLSVTTLAFADPILRRDPSDYTILANRSARLKNMYVESPGCNVGVNCPSPAGSAVCGYLQMRDAFFGGDSQVASDRLCGTGEFQSLFRNGPGQCTPDCSMIADPGSNPDCSTSWSAPILADLDGDGNASCSAACEPDVGDLAVACGVTLPFPACNRHRPVFVTPDADCSDWDTTPGNGKCDLGAGAYGNIIVRDGARLDFATGTTVACMLRAGKDTRVTSVGPALVLVPGKSPVKFNNGSDVGGRCHQLRIVTEAGPIHFGKHGEFMFDACSLGSSLRLGHDNTLRGSFFGDTVLSNLNNEALCCTDPPTPTTTTSTIPGATTTTTSTIPGATTTTTSTIPGATTTTTSTIPGATTTTTSTIPGATTTTTSTIPGATTTTSTTAPGGTTTTTTLPGGGFTRTIGYYKTHPAVTLSILQTSGPRNVCGVSISDVDVNHAHSAIEAMCVSPRGNLRLQLARQLTAATLTMAAGGATFADMSSCNAICASSAASDASVVACIGLTTEFNESGDALTAPWGSSGAESKTCEKAHKTACTILAPGSCG